MKFLDDTISKAKDLISDNASNLINRRTKVYDASTNTVIICGITLDGVTSCTVDARVTSKSQQGIHPTYYTYFDVEDTTVLSVSVLPTAKCLDLLSLLHQRQRELKGFFTIMLKENGQIKDIFRGHFLTIPKIELSAEAPDVELSFGVKSTLNSNVFTTPVVVEPTSITDTDTPTFIEE